jgi:hypothetical protein
LDVEKDNAQSATITACDSFFLIIGSKDAADIKLVLPLREDIEFYVHPEEFPQFLEGLEDLISKSNDHFELELALE